MFYSALAGFLEPGESFEDAVVREMWEEAGVRVWDVKYHSGQPWVRPTKHSSSYEHWSDGHFSLTHQTSWSGFTLTPIPPSLSEQTSITSL